MPDVTYHGGGLRPLDGAITDRLQVGSAVNRNDAVKIDTSTGKLKTTATAADKCTALVTATDTQDNAAATDEYVTVVLFGRVTGFTGLVPGALLYLSATPGKLATTGSVAVAYAETDVTAMFMPGVSTAGS